jgi:hypothetical protein
MKIFIKKYDKYTNFREFFITCKNERLYKTLVYDEKTIINNYKYIDKMKEKYKDINIELDSIESTDNEVIIFLFNLNNCYTVTLFLINIKEKKCYITGIKTDNSIFESKNSKELICENIIRDIIEIIKHICTIYKILEILYCDYSEHICGNAEINYFYDEANTLTNSIPLLYELGFRYLNSQDYQVQKNSDKLNLLITGNLEYGYLKVMIKKKHRFFSKEELKTELKNIKILYKQYKFKKIKDFLLKLKIEHSKVFSLVYFNIYRFFNFYNYGTRFMILYL